MIKSIMVWIVAFSLVFVSIRSWNLITKQNVIDGATVLMQSMFAATIVTMILAIVVAVF